MEVLNSIQTRINHLLRRVLILLMSLMILTVVWQVFTRFIMQNPSVFTDELSRYFLIWVGVLGGAYAFGLKRHLALELLMPRLKLRNKDVLRIVINGFIVLLSLIGLVYGGATFVISTLSHHQLSPGLSINGHQLYVGYIYIVAPLAGILITIYGTIDIIDTCCKMSHDKKKVNRL